MHTDSKRFYAILQIDPTATEDDLRLAFRRRAKELHPDSETGDAEAFIWLKRAYDTLNDPEQRLRYDQACLPRPKPHRWKIPRGPRYPLPDPKRRRTGNGVVRYVIAFIIMAAISLGGVQAMISLTEGPPSVHARYTPVNDKTAPAVTETPAADTMKLPGSSKTGFWDPTPPSIKP